jgi:hypothetical protein
MRLISFLYDHLPMDTHAEVPPPSLPPEPEVRVWELEALLEQYDDADPGISLHQARLVDLRGPYAESDSAFLLEEAVRPLYKPVPVGEGSARVALA